MATDGQAGRTIGDGQRVALNAIVMLLKQVIMAPLGVVFVGFMARRLGVVSWGELQASIAIVSLVTVFAGIGVRGYVAREIAVHPERGPRGLGAALVIRGGTGAVLLTLAVVVALAGKGGVAGTLVLIAALSHLATLLYSTMWLSFEAHERFQYIFYVELYARLFVIAVSSALLFLGCGVIAVALVFMGGNVLELGLTHYFVRTRLYRPVFDATRAELTGILRRSLPIGILGAIYLTMQQTDRVVLRLVADEAAVGIYGAASLLCENFNLLPDLFLSTAFAAGMRLYARDQEAFARNYRGYMAVALMLGLPIAAGVFVLADDVIHLVFGAGRYAESGAVLRVLVCQVPLAFVFQVGTLPLLAAKREKELAKLLSAALVVNVVLAVVLVSRMGAKGAAFATLSVTAGSVIGTSILARTWIRQVSATRAAKIVAATAVMALAASQARAALGMWGAIVVGASVYPAALLALRGLRYHELRELLRGRALGTTSSEPALPATPAR